MRIVPLVTPCGAGHLLHHAAADRIIAAVEEVIGRA
jgi:hypothetical protein